MYNPSNPGSNTVMHVNNKIDIFVIFCKAMGHLHDDVIQRLLVESFRLCANRRNIVDQQLPTLLDATCCIRLHTLLHVVGCGCMLLRKV